MAQLSLAQRSTMAHNRKFQNSVMAAVVKKAIYWNDSLLTVKRTDIYKRKVLAEKLMSGNAPFGAFQFTLYFLMQFNVDDSALNSQFVVDTYDFANAGDNYVLPDEAVLETSPLDVAYDFFAGILEAEKTV